MKIFIVCSTSFYNKIKPIKDELLLKGYHVILPNSYDNTITEHNYLDMTDDEYVNFFKTMFNQSRDKISKVDAILVLNFDKEKNGKLFKNYIGASTFLEMYEAFMQNKTIFMYNGYPDNLLYDEIKGFNPIILNGDIEGIK